MSHHGLSLKISQAAPGHLRALNIGRCWHRVGAVQVLKKEPTEVDVGINRSYPGGLPPKAVIPRTQGFSRWSPKWYPGISILIQTRYIYHP